MAQSVQALNQAREQVRDFSNFDYAAFAELYSARDRRSGRPSGYKRFDKSAEAIRFFIEELPAASQVGAYLEIDEVRFNHRDIAALYESPRYPLKRRVPA